MDYTKLTDLQLDTLKELFNIGTGNSVTALSKMLDKRIDMNLPKLSIAKLQEVVSDDLENEVVAVLVRAVGDAPGNIMYAFKKDVAFNIVKILLNKEVDELGEIELSAIGEIGNIIASSYINAISVFTGVALVSSVPEVVYDMLSAIVASVIVGVGQYEDYILKIETSFKGDEVNDIMGNFYYIPEPGSLENILTKIGMN